MTNNKVDGVLIYTRKNSPYAISLKFCSLRVELLGVKLQEVTAAPSIIV